MDGFHLANATLDAWGRRDRKGAPDTFDAGGYVHLLRRLRAAQHPIIYAPVFRRELETSVAGALAVGHGLERVREQVREDRCDQRRVGLDPGQFAHLDLGATRADLGR